MQRIINSENFIIINLENNIICSDLFYIFMGFKI